MLTLHQPRHTILTNHFAFATKCLTDSRAAVAPFAIVIDAPNLKQQSCILSGSLTGPPAGPSVVTGSRYLEVPTQSFYGVFPSVLPDEPERFRRSSA